VRTLLFSKYRKINISLFKKQSQLIFLSIEKYIFLPNNIKLSGVLELFLIKFVINNKVHSKAIVFRLLANTTPTNTISESVFNLKKKAIENHNQLSKDLPIFIFLNNSTQSGNGTSRVCVYRVIIKYSQIKKSNCTVNCTSKYIHL